MTNYPPTPSFGMSFGVPQPQAPTPLNNNNAQAGSFFPQAGSNGDGGFGNPWTGTAPPRQQGVVPPASIASMAGAQNAYAIQQNARHPSSNAQSFPFPPPLHPFQMLNHLPNGFPPPPYPPIPIPHQGFHPPPPMPPPGGFQNMIQSERSGSTSIPAPPAITHTSTSNSRAGARDHEQRAISSDMQSKGRGGRRSADHQGSDQGSSKVSNHQAQKAAASDSMTSAAGPDLIRRSSPQYSGSRHDQGQTRPLVSDPAQGSYATRQSPQTSLDRSLPHKYSQSNQSSHKVTSTRGNSRLQPESTTDTKSHHRTNIDSNWTARPLEESTLKSTHATTHIPASSRGLGDRSLTVPRPDHGAADGSKSATELKALAKTAILNLHPLQVRYSDFLAEGISEGVLNSLFEELGLSYPSKVPTGESSAAKVAVQTGVAQSRTPNSQQRTPYDSSSFPPSKPSSTTVVGRSQGPPSLVAPLPRPSSLPKKPSVSEKSTEVPMTLPQSQPLTSLPSSAVSSSKPSKNDPVAGPKLERKDLIAQKLAARAGKKTQPPAKPTSGLPLRTSPQQVTSDKKSPDAEGEMSDVAPKRNTHESQATQISGSHQGQQSASAVDVPPDASPPPIEKKPMDQNELIRQRLASLRQANQLPANDGPPQMGVSPLISSIHGLVVPTVAPSAAPITKLGDGLDNLARAVPTVPGLFLAGGSPPSTTPSMAATFIASELQPQNRRKRPVAADFDTEPVPVQTMPKRPFGHSRVDRPLVIDVSDDESGDGSDDSNDELYGQIGAGEGLSAGRMPDNADGSSRTAVRDMPPLSDFSHNRRLAFSRSTGAGPSSGLSTPPAPLSNGKGKANAQEDLKRKEEQIQLMQRKIADWEQRKAKQCSSRPQTPNAANPTSRSPTVASPTTAAEAAESTAEIDRLISDTHRQVEEDKAKLAEAKAVEAEAARDRADGGSAVDFDATSGRASGSGTSKKDRVRQRRAELQSILQRSEAQVESENRRLEELRKEKEEREAVVQRALEEKLRLVEELNSLGMEASDELMEDVVAKENEIIELRKPIVGETVPSAPEPQDVSSHSDADDSSKPMPLESGAVEMEPDADADADTPDLSRQSAMDVDPVDSLSPSTDKEANDHTGASSGESAEEGEITDSSSQGEVNGHSELAMGVTLGEDLPVNPPTASPARPDPARKDDVYQEDVVMGEASDFEPDQATFSDEGLADPTCGHERPSEAVPALSVAEGTDVTTEEQSPAHMTGETRDGSPASVDSDPYEPPEPVATDVTDDVAIDTPSSDAALPAGSSHFSQAPTVSTEMIATDLVSKDATSADRANIALTAGRPEAPVATTSAAASDTLTTGTLTLPTNNNHFTPYQSPLKQFRAYRYHPDYLGHVPDGFRSLTYNHTIDPLKPVCRFETSGGVCNDNTCEGQHFRDMELKDGTALIQIGSANEGRNEEERAQYTEGLKEVLQDLRNKGINEFTAVASEIAAYRSRFLKDPMRVLSLTAGNES